MKERPVDLVLADVEPEEAGEGLLALSLLNAVAVPGFAQAEGDDVSDSAMPAVTWST